jgi:hypothetical protein
MANTFETIDGTVLETVGGGTGALARLGYGAGYAAGYGVTSVLAPIKPDLAFTQVGGPLLRKWGFPNAANGAEQSVRDVAAQYGATVKENR